MARQTRREFLENTMLAAAAATAGGVLAMPVRAAEQAAGPNDRLRVAVLGVNSRGGAHVRGFSNRPDCEVTVICDADEMVGQKRCDQIESKTKKRPAFVQDLRRVMDDRNIDIVSIATPNHWHSLAAIWAVQNGKDVYVEKPVSHNVSEGRRLVEAARKHRKIVQAGMQCRSMPGTRELMQFIHQGGIGDVKLARGLCYKGRPSIGPRGEYQPPASVDYDLWSGPAPMSKLTREKFHYDWHWQWDCGNGDLGNQGIHQMDLARWALGVNDVGKGVFSYGGRLGYEDAGETANTQVSMHDYGDKTLVFEVRGLSTPSFKDARIGVIVYGSTGYAVMASYTGGKVFDLEGKEVRSFNAGHEQLHFNNFVEAVRSRDHQAQHGEILEGHLSSALCHLGNISYRLGELRSVSDVQKGLEQLPRQKDECLATFERVQEHLKANNVNLDVARLAWGANLSIDGQAETFTGSMSSRANPLLTREYRKGFAVPASAALV